MNFNISKIIFYLVYFLLFCFGGTISFLGIFPFRMVYLSVLSLLLIGKYGIQSKTVTKLFILLGFLIILSGIINDSSLKQIFMFFRFVVTPYAMFYLTNNFINHKNIIKILKLSIILAMIQLPVIIIQILFYHRLIQYSAVNIAPIDFCFGTFHVKGDPEMAFFLIGIILFLLFDNRNNFFIKNKTFIVIWLTITIFLSNSRIVYLILIFILCLYLVKNINNMKSIIKIGFISLIIIGIFTFSGYQKGWNKKMERVINKITFQEEANYENFISGRYSRVAATRYYLNEPIKLIGDGPSKYYDPLTREYTMGNTGQIFTFYSEIGILGLIMGYLILFEISKKKKGRSPSIALLYFLAIACLTITNSVMSTASVMLSYNIFLSTNYVQKSYLKFVNKNKD